MKVHIRPWALVIAIGLIASIALSGFAYAALGDRLLGRGSKGSEVIELQKKLIQLGYTLGKADGKFGSKTEAAVRRFQKEHGLRVDGLAGTQTIKELKRLTGQSTNATGKAVGYKNTDTNLLARTVNAEARGEPYIGQVAVAAVILNRIADPAFPKTIADIVYQPRAFSSVDDGQINLPPSASAIRAAQEAINGSDPSGGALFFFAPAKTKNKFIWSRPQIKQIGNHIFTK
ncbi:spore cortex-lytic enzyme [Desulfosporosinus sp. BICA1-9]|uniref:spore cortex-lytic enzyme n=1 Tax=Desulfosporosinus sp. BICA1-9 TaxID=1531958 RepID=UPI00054B706D|nr:spore cortex-lytic enzyme [Desulfosporosinus sp. BICA1-9]KJS46586.1 MAG: cell wall hydrolase [Peptococcaceae bacterium BRH_c23]KJS87366.1 MAG: cell wall hydrolase [Desulfosporosinus sp. BICA1-9]HBW36589.1 spore cortex-lytic enzyme [Desulfosporosinus sp.]